MKQHKKSILLCLAAGAVIAAAVIALGISRENGIVRCVSDGFFVAAVMLFGVGVIMWVRNKGTFDAIGFGLSSVFRLHVPAAYDIQKREEFSEYRKRKEKARRPGAPLIIAGAIYLAASVAALIVYYIV